MHLEQEGKGYVWVFTNQEEVVFLYRPTREGGFLRDLFKDFCGVLISDFYAPYDALPCAQQKCLIHLIRDFNADIQGNPWDEELKALASSFGQLLLPLMAEKKSRSPRTMASQREKQKATIPREPRQTCALSTR